MSSTHTTCLLPWPACLVWGLGLAGPNQPAQLLLPTLRLAVDSSSHLSPQDKAVLLEYPLHRVGRSLPPSLQSSVLAGITAPPLDTGREGGGGGDEGEGGEGGEEGEGGGEGDGGEGSSHDDPASADESETATELPPAKRVKVGSGGRGECCEGVRGGEEQGNREVRGW